MWPVLTCIVVLVLGRSALALAPDEVVLIANGAVPQSMELNGALAPPRITRGH